MTDTTKPIEETTDAATPAKTDELPQDDLDTVAGGARKQIV